MELGELLTITVFRRRFDVQDFGSGAHDVPLGVRYQVERAESAFRTLPFATADVVASSMKRTGAAAF